MSTITLTETLVEIADHHTTLFYLKKDSSDSPLPFTSSGSYNQLHQDIYDKGNMQFSEARKQYQAKVLKRLSPGYDNYKYWHRSLLSDQAHLYPQRAWEDMLPITATFVPRINLLKPQAFKFRVLPVPKVVLYPFGWSTWLSLRILDAHTLEQLGELLQHLFTRQAFQLEPDTSWLSLAEVMKQLGNGVRGDAFGGDQTNDIVSSDLTLVTTVLAKHNGSPSVAAIGKNEAALRRIVEPASASPQKKFSDFVYRFDQNDPLEFMLLKDHARFIWMEHLLDPVERKRQLLSCYHQNTFRLLVHARQLFSLLNELVKLRTKTTPIVELVSAVVRFLEDPTFRNASLIAFLADPKVAKLLARALKWSGNRI